MSHVTFRQFLIFLLMLFFSQAIGQQTAKLRIAVIDFSTTGGLSDQETVTLTKRLNSMLVRTNAFIVLERGKMDEILKEQGFQQLGCTTTECAVEVGKLLNVQKIINGFIGKIGKTYTIDISLIDISSAQIERSFVQDYKGETDGLLDIMESISLEIATITRAPKQQGQAEKKIFNISIGSQPDGARVFVNDREVGDTPFKSKVREGTQLEIRILKQNYDEWYQKMTVTREVDINANLKISKEYARELADKQKSGSSTKIEDEGGSSLWWWVGGAVVVGGAAAVLLSGSGGDDGGGDPVTTTDQGFPEPPVRP
jgi:TolB-like protein